MSCYVPTTVADTSPGGHRVTLAIDLDVFNVGSTPLQMLLTVIILTLIIGLVIVVVTQIFSPYLNRRWPATAPLSPTELLWGEAGGHVKRTFRGLDLEEQKDLASQLNERKVPAGTAITSQGDAATAFYLLKSGSAEAVQTEPGGGERKLREYAEGDSFGEVAILERSPRTATVPGSPIASCSSCLRGLRRCRRADCGRRQRLHRRRPSVPRHRPRPCSHRLGRACAQPRAADAAGWPGGPPAAAPRQETPPCRSRSRPQQRPPPRSPRRDPTLLLPRHPSSLRRRVRRPRGLRPPRRPRALRPARP